MAAATTRSGRKLPSIRTLWAIAKSPELGLTDEDLHGVVYRETGKGSMKQLTQGEITAVARVLQNMKDSAARGSRSKRTDEGGNRGWGSRSGKCGGSAGRRRTSRSRPGPWWIG